MVLHLMEVGGGEEGGQVTGTTYPTPISFCTLLLRAETGHEHVVHPAC